MGSCLSEKSDAEAKLVEFLVGNHRRVEDQG